MKSQHFSILLTSFLGLVFLATNAAAIKKQPQLLNEVISKYRQASIVEIVVEKTLKSELLDKKTESEGKIYLSKEKFRFDIDKPEKSQIIFDGHTIWSIQHPPAEFPGPVQVAKAFLSKNTQKQILISTLFAPGGIRKNFKIVDFKEDSEVENYFLDPITSELSLKNLNMKINKKRKVIDELSYKDDVGNETILKFKNTEFQSKPKNSLFNYAPPKGSPVTNL